MDGYFIGANAPIKDLIELVDQKKSDVIGLSMSIYFNYPILENALARIRTHFKDIPILIGGQAFRWGGKDILKKFKDVSYIENILHLEKEIVTF